MAEEEAITIDQAIAQINGFYDLILNAEKGTLDYAMKCGVLLKACKSEVGHGNWAEWLRVHCPKMPARTASHYMKFVTDKAQDKLAAAAEAKAARDGVKSASVADLSVGEAMAALAPPPKTEAQKLAAKARRDEAKAAKEAGNFPSDAEPTEESVKTYMRSLSADDIAKLLTEVFDEDFIASLRDCLETGEDLGVEVPFKQRMNNLAKGAKRVNQ